MTINEKQLRQIIRETIENVLLDDAVLNEGKLGKALGAAALGAGLMLGHPQDANAQLNITNQIQNSPQKLMTIRMGYSYLYRSSNGWYCISLLTDNKFDKGMDLWLGKNEQSAYMTVKDLKGLLDKHVAMTSVQQPTGKLDIFYQSQMGVGNLWMQSENNVGKSYLTDEDVNKLIKFFDKTYHIGGGDADKLYNEFKKLKAIYDNAAEEMSNSKEPEYISIKKEQRIAIFKKMSEIADKLQLMGISVNL